MATWDRFDFLIVDPDSAGRGKLKQAAMALTTFNHVYTVATLDEALSKTGGADNIDVVALSYRFSEHEIAGFMSQAKQTPRGKEWAYMALLKSKDQQEEVVERGFLGGLDGFLFEPYSADNLREMAEITAKVKLQNEQMRKKRLLSKQLGEVVTHFDAFAFCRWKGQDPEGALLRLKEAMLKVQKTTGDDIEVYADALGDVCKNAEPFSSKSYTGVSQRVKAMLERRLRAKLLISESQGPKDEEKK